MKCGDSIRWICFLAVGSVAWLSVRAVTAEDAADSVGLRVGAAAVNLEADDSMVIAGGIGPRYVKGQEGGLRAAATVLEVPGQGKGF